MKTDKFKTIEEDGVVVYDDSDAATSHKGGLWRGDVLVSHIKTENALLL